MSLVNLMDFDPDSAPSRDQWDLSHSSDHVQIREAIQAQGGGNLQDWVLYPVNWQDWDAYALRHQQEHDEMNAAVGAVGSDLTSVDFTDQKARQEWHFTHFKEHQSARSVLGI